VKKFLNNSSKVSPIIRATNNGKNRGVSLPKTPTGIQGLDEITFGGLPKGRPTLICGSAGCGKTLFSIEFLVHGATRFNEPGVFIAFEETEEDLRKNVASLGYDLKDLADRKNWLSITFTSSAAKSKRPENTTSRACSFVWLRHRFHRRKAGRPGHHRIHFRRPP
jgi:KaiC/GvpD/RAD55 family RecA-like ATPase